MLWGDETAVGLSLGPHSCLFLPSGVFVSLPSPLHFEPTPPTHPFPQTDKDLFSEFYRKKLARRLLHSTSGESNTLPYQII